MRKLVCHRESWEFNRPIVISRGTRYSTHTVCIVIYQNGFYGRGECLPYPHYGESVDSVVTQLESVRESIERGVGRVELQSMLPPGAARNALDCALWDLDAQASNIPVMAQCGLSPKWPLLTSFTILLDTPSAMAEAARSQKNRPVLKMKLAGQGDLQRVEAVHAASPNASLIVDANEALSFRELKDISPILARLGVILIEQPLRAGGDEELEGFACPIPMCADESIHTRAELDICARRYQYINIKLDKSGGLTEALELARAAKAKGLKILAGCMATTSLAVAPALVIAQFADCADLDAPLFLSKDRVPGLTYRESLIDAPPLGLWGDAVSAPTEHAHPAPALQTK